VQNAGRLLLFEKAVHQLALDIFIERSPFLEGEQLRPLCHGSAMHVHTVAWAGRTGKLAPYRSRKRGLWLIADR
jgi:hypothetical protein